MESEMKKMREKMEEERKMREEMEKLVDERKGAVKETEKLECENRKLGKFIERLEDRLSWKRERKELSGCQQ
jgi:hypothetical protein